MLLLLKRASLSVLVLLLASGVHAGSISVERWRGHEVLRLSGAIESGLADELLEKIELAELWSHGARVLLLDGPGGDVDEALRISAVLDKFPFHTVVPNGALCASACGSVIFVAGKFRTVETFGAIGQHSCSVNGIQNDDCNEELAMHAVAHGVSHGSIAAFVTAAAPEEMIWFSREDVDGWGLSRYPGEEESGFEKSEPRVIRALMGSMPPAQSAWRLDFGNDGYRAFLRPVSDAGREMQLNVFCYENLPGRLFLSMEIHGPEQMIRNSLVKVSVASDDYGWTATEPWIVQDDPSVTSVVTEIPPNSIKTFLTASDLLIFQIDYLPPFQPMRATTYLAQSRKNLLFAANHCTRGEYGLNGQPL